LQSHKRWANSPAAGRGFAPDLKLKRTRFDKDRSMSFRKLTGGAIAVALLFAAPLHAQDAKDTLVAKVNGVEIHQSDLDAIETEAG
jgi:hypothetical protein